MACNVHVQHLDLPCAQRRHCPLRWVSGICQQKRRVFAVLYSSEHLDLTSFCSGGRSFVHLLIFTIFLLPVPVHWSCPCPHAITPRSRINAGGPAGQSIVDDDVEIDLSRSGQEKADDDDILYAFVAI